MCSFGSDETRELLAILLPLVPAVFYGMGLMEGKQGQRFFLAGILSHIIVMIIRGITIGVIPLTEKHDTISFMAFSTAFAYLQISRKNEIKDLGLIVLPVISLIMVAAVMHKPINTISPLLRTPWFYLHSFLFFLSYGYFGISFCTGLVYIFRRESGLEALQYNSALSGWIIYTVSLIIGSVWFYIAYGTYWIWTSKELWTTLVWFSYALYLHVRMLQGMRGIPASIIGSIGYALVLFAYFGIGTVIPSPPTQF